MSSVHNACDDNNFGYRIMKIVRDGKLSWLHCLIEIRGKTFVVV